MKLLLPVLDLFFPFELTSSSPVLDLGNSNCFQLLRPSLCIDATSQVNETTLHYDFPVTRNAKQLWDHTSTSQYDCQLHKQYMTTLYDHIKCRNGCTLPLPPSKHLPFTLKKLLVESKPLQTVSTLLPFPQPHAKAQASRPYLIFPYRASNRLFIARNSLNAKHDLGDQLSLA